MCLAIPGKITAITADFEGIFRMGKVSFDGVTKDVNLSMTPEAQTGDYVLVHVGVAIGLIDEAEAHLTLAALRELGELESLSSESHPIGDALRP